MTVYEALDHELAVALKMQGGCFRCHGRGDVADLSNEVFENGKFIYPSKTCEECGGTGGQPDPTSLFVVGALASAVIRVASSCREVGNFDGMNQALDWGMQFLNMQTKYWVDKDPELVKTTLAKIGDAYIDVVRDQHQPTKLEGALTEEELKDLGLDE